MSYSVFYTEAAERDLVDIFEYIARDLQVPETAKKQLGRILSAINSLDKMPERHGIFKEEPWHSKELRVLPVDNYLVFYLVIKKENIVAIVRIMYGRRNISENL